MCVGGVLQYWLLKTRPTAWNSFRSLSLLQQHDVMTETSQLTGHRPPGRSGADNDEINGVVRVEAPARRALPCLTSEERDHASPPRSARRFAGWSYHPKGARYSIASAWPTSFHPTKSLLPPCVGNENMPAMVANRI